LNVDWRLDFLFFFFFISTSTFSKITLSPHSQSRIRNLCVLAHVDHGKTTLTDHLIASNGIVHPRLAGELRFLDSRDDEQARGITMKASAISLAGAAPEGMELEERRKTGSLNSSSTAAREGGAAEAAVAAPAPSSRPPSLRPTAAAASPPSSAPAPPAAPDQSRLLLYNLVDSPGHVDFCSEVGAAARLCDGCLVVVDAVEGVCVQTRAVLRQAHEERLGMCLVVNKVDRLVGELGMDAAAAARRLEAVVAHANLVVSGFRSEDAMSEADAVLADAEAAEAAEAKAAGAAANGGEEEEDGGGKGGGEDGEDENDRDAFDPARGNVAFASAQDGWAFTTAELAATCARRLGGIPLDSPAFKALQRASWGPWCLDARAKRVVKAASKGGKKASAAAAAQKTLFVQLGLEPVWRAYGAASDAASAVRYGDKASAAAALEEAREKLGAMATALALPPRAAAAVAAAATAGSSGSGGGGSSGSASADAVRSAARALLRGWAPMAPALLHMAARHLPSPRAAAPLRVPRLLAGPSSGPGPPPGSPLLGGGGGEDGEATETERGDRRTPLPSLPVSEEEAAVERAALTCDASRGAPLVAYVGKMIAVPARAIPRKAAAGGSGGGDANSNGGEEDVFLAFTRIFSGELRDGDPIFVLSSGYDPAEGAAAGEAEEKKGGEEEQREGGEAAAAAAAARAFSSLTLSSPPGVGGSRGKNSPSPVVVDGIFIMMGSALSRVSAAPAGALVALGGLSDRVSKTATLVSSLKGARPLARVALQAASIVRVAVEARDPARQGDVARGLRALDRADPAVTVSVLPSGEHVLGAAGEVHLEMAVKDLRERYARCELVVSAPIAAFRESAADAAAERAAAVASAASAADAAAVPPLPRHVKVVEVSTPGGAVTLRARAVPLPGALAAVLDVLDPSSLAGMMTKGGGESSPCPSSSPSSELLRLRSRLSSAVAKYAPVLGARCWALGPGGAGPCMLLSDDFDGGGGDEEEEEAAGGEKSKSGSTKDRRAAAFASASSAASIWSVPKECVVTVTRDGGTFGGGMQAHEEAAAAAAQRGGGGGGGGEDGDVGSGEAATSSDGAAAAASAAAAAAEEAAAGKRAYVRLGEPAVARALGWRSKKEEEEEASVSSPARASSTSSAAPRPSPPPLLLGPAAARAAEDAAAGVAAGFQMASAAGPLCDEPVWGVAFEVSARLEGLAPSSAEPPAMPNLPRPRLLDLPASAAASDVYGPLVGQVAAATRSLLRASLRCCPGGARLVEPVLLCEVSAATAEALSGVYAALGRRRARVLRETAREGGGVFSVHAHLPAQGALGLADDLRARSSGAASASLLLSHWERLPVDPFFAPKTEVEREELGEEGQGGGGGPNLARRLVDAVRERKGLPVAARVVESATKQRTRARKV